MNRRNKVQLWVQLVGTALSGGVFIWLLSKQNWEQVLRTLNHLPLWAVLLSLVFLLGGQFANSLRWHVLLLSQKIPIQFRQTTRIVFSGAFASNFLPTTIGGDVLRVVSLHRFTESRLMALGSVILDRILNVLAMVSFLPLVWVSFDVPRFLSSPSVLKDMTISIAGFVQLRFGILKKFKRAFEPLINAYRIWSHRPVVLVEAFIISWLSLISVFIGVWILSRAIGIPVALYQVTAISSLVYLLTLLPFSINGYGVREVAVTALYIQVGATLEQASTLALLTRILSLIATLPGALWLSQVVAGPLRNAEIESGEPPMATQED
jgi:uncharacterized membrane protein YbhN (UPF0104 family)